MPSLLRPWCLLVLLAGCASAPPEPPVAPPAPGAPAPVAEPVVPKRAVPPGQLRREDVLAVLSEGPPALLRKVDVEPAVDGEGRFQGWRVMAVRDPLLAAGEVQPGDVIRRVNGQSIERPFEFFDVFQSLAFAPTLTLAIERNNQARDLSYPINDDPSAPPVPRPDKVAPGASAATAPAATAADKKKAARGKR